MNRDQEPLIRPNRYILANFPPSAVLLAAQLLLMVLYVVFDEQHSQRTLVGAFGAVVLAPMVWVVKRSPGVNWVAWVLAIPAFVLSLLSAAINDSGLLTWAALLSAGLYFYAAGSLIAYMLGDYQVTTDELFAAGATFTLLAWGFAYLYLICQAWVPGSFVSSIISDRPLTFVELLFLSFANLSATGLSDIMAASPWARVLVMWEQFFGIGYVAIVVSRLVGLIGQRQERKPG